MSSIEIGCGSFASRAQGECRVGRPHALGNHLHAGQYFPERTTARELDAHVSIPAQRAGARQHEVAEPGQAAERRRLRAERHPETDDFREPARDERRAGVLPEAEPVAEARGQRHDVLERAAKLDAQDVSIGVQPEGGCGQLALQAARHSLVPGGDHEGGRLAHRDFTREGRAGQNGHRVPWRDLAEQP